MLRRSKIILFLLLMPVPVSAGTGLIAPSLDAPLGGSKVTVVEVLRAAFPDLTPQGRYTRIASLRPEAQTMDVTGEGGAGEGVVEAVEGAVFIRGRETYAVLLAAPASVLVLAQISPTYRALDAVHVGQDVHANLSSDVGLLSLGQDRYAVAVVSWHVNAGEEFRNYLLMGVDGDKLKVFYDGPFLYGFVEPGGERSCRVVQEAKWERLTAAREGYGDLKLAVVEKRFCGDPGTEKTVSERRFQGTLNWDPAQRKYMGGLKDLFRLNHRRLGQ